jgi:hypothetical protein
MSDEIERLTAALAAEREKRERLRRAALRYVQATRAKKEYGVMQAAFAELERATLAALGDTE